MAQTTGGSAPSGGTRLQRRSLGVGHLVFMIVAASAPLTAVAGGQATTYLVTGNKAVPFMFIPLGIVLGIFSIGYAAMSRHVANAGAFYAYVSRGLGKVGGVGAAFVALIAYNAMQIGIYGLLGVALGSFMSGRLGIDAPWWVWVLLAWAVIAVLGVLQIDLNARVLAVLLTLEVLAVALFDLAVLAKPGPEGLTTIGFNPLVAFGAAAGATLTFSVASFMGFESAAIYSEECRNPRKTVARATLIGVSFIALFYALSSWMVGVAAGPDTMVDPKAMLKAGYATAGAPDPTTVLFIAGQERLGVAWGDAASLLFVTSIFAANLSFHNAVARYIFALGREGVLPRLFGRVHPRTGSPWIASISQSLLAVVVFGIFAILGLNPLLTLFTWLTNLGALGVLLLMSVTSFAVASYFRRNPEAELSRWTTTIAPNVAGVLLVALLVLGVANFNVLITSSTTAPLSPLTVILPVILFGGGLAGLLVGVFLRSRHPDVYAGIGEGAGPMEPEDEEAVPQEQVSG
ncbi:MAG: APC family permease [Rubrobacteraceae bacterium]|uniref:APC family permease n=1 Tax=Rubrobacter naiadicus TaxID=1392641 RepID=UPI0023622BA7|nr:APC family permease [Rubrobacter naiadicus]MBX6764396.1 APC family permease [Rubrobacteraceae bacterium]MCL6437011.1 APC family permease [Rubrobacteraceae bacterium]